MSDPSPIRTDRTTAVVVGIEQYAAGSDWNLNGPVPDARRFVDWFLCRGVPPDRVIALTAPLRRNPDPWDGSPVPAVAATQGALRSLLVRELPALEGDLLWVVWGGHGMVDADGRRRLFSADATGQDPVNIDLDEVLAFYRSAAVPSFPRQLWFVDACQTLHDGSLSRRSLPHEVLPRDVVPLPGRLQEVVLAASPGERAANLAMERTGLFSREVLAELPQVGPEWPPDVGRLVERQRARFLELRRAGLARQTPTYFWYRDSRGEEGQVLAETKDAPPSSPVNRRAALSAESALVDALLDLPVFRDPGGRAGVIGLLRGEVAGNLRQHAVPRWDAVSLVTTCRDIPGSLPELVEAVRLFAGDTPQVDALAAAVRAFEEESGRS
jgi:Effector-associated domain 2